MSALPTHIGAYKLLRKIGEGGMGAVYEALQESIERRVAIKILQPEYARDAEITKRFFNEARAANRIDHPSLVQIHEHGHLPEGTAYIVMEYLKGETLAQRMRQLGGRVPERLALQIAWQVATALTAAHDKAIVHRDLKPANLMLVPDPLGPGGERVKVLDFGIAKLVAEAHQGKTAGSLVMGTPTYMSPEQCRGAGAVDEKTDVYSLGIILFEMLVGRPPFVSAGAGELLGMQLFQPVPSILELAPDVHPDTAAFTLTLLSKDRSQRPSMREVAQHLAPLTLLAGVPKPLPTAASNLLPALEPATVFMADPHPLSRESAATSGPSGPSGTMPIVGDKHVSEVAARPSLAAALLGCGVLAALGLAWMLAAPARQTSATSASATNAGPSAQVAAASIANSSPSAEFKPEAVDVHEQADSIDEPTQIEQPDLSDVHPVGNSRKPSKRRDYSSDYARKETPTPPPPNPSAEQKNPILENLLLAAQEEYSHNQYKEAIHWARQAQKKSPESAWLLTGQAACHLRDMSLADEASKHLEAVPLQDLLDTCLKLGIEHRHGAFTVVR